VNEREREIRERKVMALRIIYVVQEEPTRISGFVKRF
jgi:hypothetical protein